MEKLSSVLPNSPRVKSVDLKNAQPVRPGSVSAKYGVPVGMTTKDRDRMSLSAEARDRALQDSFTQQNTRESSQAKIAETVTRKFFENRLNEVVPPPLTKEELGSLDEAAEIPATDKSIKSAKLDLQA